MDAKLKLPFEAVAVRYVHDVRAEEFLNVGVILMCAQRRYAAAQFLPHWGRVTAAFPGADLILLRKFARAFEDRASAWFADRTGQQVMQSGAGVEALARSVIVPDHSSVQLSPVISGVTADPERTLGELFLVYAGAALPKQERESRDDDEVWRDFTERSRVSPSLLRQLQARVLRVQHYELAFANAWKNGTWNVAQPVSFDLIDPRAIRDKAASWTGKLHTLKPHELDTNVYLLVGMPSESRPEPVRKAASDALAILEDNVGREAQVVTEERSAQLAEKIAHDLATDAP